MPTIVIPLSLVLAVYWPVLAFLLALVIRAMLLTRGWQPVSASLQRAEAVPGESPTARFDVTYSYLVDGKEYIGHRFSSHSTSRSGNRHSRYSSAIVDAQLLTLRQQQEQTGSITVYYSPSDPGDSVIKPGPRPGHFVQATVLIALITAPLFFL